MTSQESSTRSGFTQVGIWRNETSPLQQQPIRVKNIRDLKATPNITEPLLVLETKQCITCKNVVKEEESTYLMWQGMYFCDTVCLRWYQQQNLLENCVNCFTNIPSDCTGKFVFRYDRLLQFCSIPCFHEYQVKRKSCLYCMSKILSFAVSLKKHNPFYCSDECAIKHIKTQGVDLIHPDLSQNCIVCMSNLHPITIHYQSGDNIISICNQFCLQTYAGSLQVSPLLCNSCKMYFSPSSSFIVKVHKGSTCILCSKKCENYVIFSDLKVYACGYCNIKRFDIDLIQRYSKIEPKVYMCSIECYLKKYSALQPPSTAEKLFTIGVNTISTLNQPSISRAVLKPLESFRNVILPPIIEENGTTGGNNLDPLNLKLISATADKPTVTNTCFIVRSDCTFKQKNIATMCSVQKADKCSYVKQKTFEQGSQTDFEPPKNILVPVPVPMYVPIPMHMYSVPIPSPVPFPLPIPIPIFIPTKNWKKIVDDIKSITYQSPAPNNRMEDDILSIAESDVHKELSNEIASSETATDGCLSDYNMNDKADTSNNCSNSSIINGISKQSLEASTQDFEITSSKCFNSFTERKSLNMHVGIHAWQQWMKITKTVVLADPSNIDILIFASSQLADCLSLFVSEVKRPNGKSYAPDTIFYLCLSIQKYLFEYGRIDNIFFDEDYKDFTRILDNQMKIFPLLFLDSSYIVTRIEEEHLWESKQLGVNSPYVLLNTILYNNMKYFHLMSLEENMDLLRCDIVETVKKEKDKHGEFQKVLRFYPNRDLKVFYEMTPSSKNPERCPLKLFDFYWSKLSSVGSETFGQFYFMPLASCVAVNPIWYSAESVDKGYLEIMINRLKVVKELNIHKENFEE